MDEICVFFRRSHPNVITFHVKFKKTSRNGQDWAKSIRKLGENSSFAYKSTRKVDSSLNKYVEQPGLMSFQQFLRSTYETISRTEF